MITPEELLALVALLPPQAVLVLPDQISVERPGESVGRIYRSPKGEPKYQEY